MHLLIKDMNMPRYCFECILCDTTQGEGVCRKTWKPCEHSSITRNPDCPLSEFIPATKKTGIWITRILPSTLDYVEYVCSECKGASPQPTHYCGNCGLKMCFK